MTRYSKGACGFYCITREKNGSEEVLIPWTQNLITDTGLLNLCEGRLPQEIVLGTGNPSNIAKNGTSLGNRVAKRGFSSEDGGFAMDSGSGEHYYWFMASSTFPPHQGVAGETLTEVGFRDPDSGGKLYTWAEIQPAIQPAADDTLKVWYEIRFYQISTSDQSGAEMIKGSSNNYTARVMGIGTAQSHDGRLPLGGRVTISAYGSSASLGQKTSTSPDSNGDLIARIQNLDPYVSSAVLAGDAAIVDARVDVGADTLVGSTIHIITVEAYLGEVAPGVYSPSASLPTGLQVSYSPGFMLSGPDVMTFEWTHALLRYSPVSPEPRN